MSSNIDTAFSIHFKNVQFFSTKKPLGQEDSTFTFESDKLVMNSTVRGRIQGAIDSGDFDQCAGWVADQSSEFLSRFVEQKGPAEFKRKLKTDMNQCITEVTCAMVKVTGVNIVRTNLCKALYDLKPLSYMSPGDDDPEDVINVYRSLLPGALPHPVTKEAPSDRILQQLLSELGSDPKQLLLPALTVLCSESNMTVERQLDMFSLNQHDSRMMPERAVLRTIAFMKQYGLKLSTCKRANAPGSYATTNIYVDIK